jgi:hypothetical protein
VSPKRHAALVRSSDPHPLGFRRDHPESLIYPHKVEVIRTLEPFVQEQVRARDSHHKRWTPQTGHICYGRPKHHEAAFAL